MNKYIYFLGYQGPNTLLAVIVIMLYLQGETNPYAYGAVLVWKLVNHLINITIKNSLKAPRPDSHKDPNFSNLKPTLKNFFTVHQNFGMPSGHAQDVIGELTFIGLYFQKPWVTLLATAQAALTLWHRYESHRHSIKQLFVGSTLGFIAGLVFYQIYKEQFNGANQITRL
jgi:membrane-associated phospholipid phosphatase